MTINAFIQRLKADPASVTIDEALDAIAEAYEFEPVAFTNGHLQNAAGENIRSCQLYAFGLLNNLTKEETLACFGAYYFEDVLKHPEGTDHQTIRVFMKQGWDGIKFDAMPLKERVAAR